TRPAPNPPPAAWCGLPSLRASPQATDRAVQTTRQAPPVAHPTIRPDTAAPPARSLASAAMGWSPLAPTNHPVTPMDAALSRYRPSPELATLRRPPTPAPGSTGRP